MEQRLDEILAQRLPSIENTEEFLTGIRQRDGVLQVASASSGDSTPILQKLSSLDVSQFNLLSATVLLSAQAKNLPSAIYNSFLQVALQVLGALNDDMIRALHQDLPAITRSLATIACQTGKLKTVFVPIRRIAESISSVHHGLSPVHVDVLQVAIKGLFYSAALTFIEKQDIVEVDPKQTELTSEDVLRYFYYVGMCYMSMKKHRQALGHFTTLLMVPAVAFSHIVEEAVKKCKLLSLIVHGKQFELPRNASQVVLRWIAPDSSRYSSTSGSSSGGSGRVLLAAYDDLAHKFTATTTTFAELNSCLESHHKAFEDDRNTGLAQQAVSSWQRKRLHELAESFVTMSFAEVAQALGTSSQIETENILMSTVQEEGLLAYVDMQEGSVVFSENPSTDAESTERQLNMQNLVLTKQLEGSMQQLVSLTNHVRSLQAEGLASQQYIRKMTSSGSAGGRVGSVASEFLEF